MFVALRPWRTSTRECSKYTLCFYRGRFDFLIGRFDSLGGRFDFHVGRFDPDTLAIGRFDQPPVSQSEHIWKVYVYLYKYL